MEIVAKVTANISSLCIPASSPHSEAYFFLTELFACLMIWVPDVRDLFVNKLLLQDIRVKRGWILVLLLLESGEIQSSGSEGLDLGDIFSLNNQHQSRARRAADK